MNEQLKAYLDDQAQALDEDVRGAIEICGGDIVQALRTALIANAFLLEENERLKAEASAGFARRKRAK